MHPIVIVGSGLAGYNLARELRKLDKETPLTLISADSGHFYSKPMLSSALSSKKTAAAIALNSPQQMTAQINADVRAHTRVSAIDDSQHIIQAGEHELPYSKLILTLGADQILLPFKGNAAQTVMTVNDLDEYAAFRTAIQDKHSVAVIGAGLIGCEFAHDLASVGHEVHVIDIAPYPLSRLLPPEGGELMRSKLAAMGVVWHMGTGVSSIDADGGATRVTLDNGETFSADAVLSAIGLKPRIDLARSANIAVNRGIIVNRGLETSAADVYALGDCAEVEGLVLPYVMPIMHKARALAATLAGKPTQVSYPAMPVLVKTPACPTIVSPPPAGAVGEWEVTVTADGVKSLFRDASGKLLGFALNGSATAERAALTPQLPAVMA